MKYKDLLQTIRKETGLDEATVNTLASSTVRIVADRLCEGDSLSIQGFGTFEVKKHEERLSVHPATGKRFIVPPKLVPVFRPGATLKERIKTYSGHE